MLASAAFFQYDRLKRLSTKMAIDKKSLFEATSGLKQFIDEVFRMANIPREIARYPQNS